jgi:hypothetical protein
VANALGLDRKFERNLRRLATYLWHLSTSTFIRHHKFDMLQYSDSATCDRERNNCGTVGCALGHAPYAGIAKHTGEDWDEYCNRQFDVYSELWRAFFSSNWVEVDNTPRGAAKRILFCLKNGIPEFIGERQQHLFPKYKRYQPSPTEFVKLSKVVLNRLGLDEQDPKTISTRNTEQSHNVQGKASKHKGVRRAAR